MWMRSYASAWSGALPVSLALARSDFYSTSPHLGRSLRVVAGCAEQLDAEWIAYAVRLRAFPVLERRLVIQVEGLSVAAVEGIPALKAALAVRGGWSTGQCSATRGWNPVVDEQGDEARTER